MPFNHFLELYRRVADLERRINNVMRPARVTEVDAKKGLVKVAWAKDENGEDVESPWIPWTERAGDIKTWTPPSKGEQVHLFSPSGEIGKHSWVLTGGFSDQNPAPHDKEAEQVVTMGDTRITKKGDQVIIETPKCIVKGNVQLGDDGGPAVARIGDKTSDGATIVTGSSKVFAA